jgi:anti-anti-sigma factor
VHLAPSYDGAGGAVVRLQGRLDAGAAADLAAVLDELLRDGVRVATLELAGVSYVSSAGVQVLARATQEFGAARGELRACNPVPAVRAMLERAGLTGAVQEGRDTTTLRARTSRGSMPSLSLAATSEWRSPMGQLVLLHGMYETTPRAEGTPFTCRVAGDAGWLERGWVLPELARAVTVPEDGLALGVGGIGATFDDVAPRAGELLGAAAAVAYQPTEGHAVPDYLVGTPGHDPRAVLLSGMVCEGPFHYLTRFTKRPTGHAVPLSELARVALDLTGRDTAAVVLLAETTGLVGAWLRRPPTAPEHPARFAVPGVREWFGTTPERVHEGSTTLVCGLVSRRPDPLLAPFLRPIGVAADLLGHFHAAVFDYRPVPLRTVALRPLMTKYFGQQPLRAVLHLLHDDRGPVGAGESAFLRGIAWVSGVTAVEAA